MGASKPIFTCNYLSLYSWMGYFPCLKNEAAKLIPMSWKLQLLLYFFSTVIPIGGYVVFAAIIAVQNDLSLTRWFAMLRASDDESMTMGTSLYLAVITMVFGQHLIVQLGTRKIKDELCEMQQLLSQSLGTCTKKFTTRSVIMTCLILVGSVAFSFGFNLNLKTFLDTNLALLIVGIVSHVFFSFALSSPVQAFYYIYGEISRGLEEWILSITHELKSTQKLTNSLFSTCRKLHSALMKSTSLLSFNVLVNITASLIGMIVVVFMSFDFFMSHADFTSAGNSDQLFSILEK